MLYLRPEMCQKKCWTEKSNENLALASLPNLFIWMGLRAKKACTIHGPRHNASMRKRLNGTYGEVANASTSSTWFMFYIKSTELMCAFATRSICWLQLAAVHRNKILIASTYGRNKIVHLPEQKNRHSTSSVMTHTPWTLDFYTMDARSHIWAMLDGRCNVNVAWIGLTQTRPCYDRERVDNAWSDWGYYSTHKY